MAASGVARAIVTLGAFAPLGCAYSDAGGFGDPAPSGEMGVAGASPSGGASSTPSGGAPPSSGAPSTPPDVSSAKPALGVERPGKLSARASVTWLGVVAPPDPGDPDPGDPDPGDPDPGDPDPGDPDPTPEPASICTDATGGPIPYDFSRGIAGEYAFELAFDCGTGGFMQPLVDMDPIGLSAVDVFVTELTDWYRAKILVCAGAQSALGANQFGLVPSSQAAGMSLGDFRAVIVLFERVLDRHDDQPDGLTAEQRVEVRARLGAFEAGIENPSDALTRLSSMPECAPPPGEGGGSEAP